MVHVQAMLEAHPRPPQLDAAVLMSCVAECPDRPLARAQVPVCVEACAVCRAERERLAADVERCRRSADACRRCEDACRELLSALPA